MSLTNIQVEKVRAFLDDPQLVEAVKDVLLSVTAVSPSELAEQFPNNETLGAKTRALAEGREFVEKGFEKLSEYQRRVIISEKKNKAI